MAATGVSLLVFRDVAYGSVESSFAVLALFAEARRSPARGGRLEVAEFLAALPALPWPQAGAGADAGRIRNAVELLTAHRARGREWPLTVVAGVQEGVWPGDGGGLGLLGEELLEPGGSPRAARRSLSMGSKTSAISRPPPSSSSM